MIASLPLIQKNPIRAIEIILLAVCFPLLLKAQTGPAGIGNSSTNVLWLRSDQGIPPTADGNPINAWNDISGNGNNSTQGNAAYQPLYILSGINGLPTIRFDGVLTNSDFLTVPDADNLDNTNGVSVFVVAQPDAIDANPRGLVSKRVSSGTETAYSLFTYTGNNLYFDSPDRINGTTAVTNNAQILTGVYDGSVANPRARVFQDGVQTGSGDSDPSIGNMASSLYVGILNAGYAQGFRGDLSEVIVYRDNLNFAQRLIVETYLSNRYGIAITPTAYTSTTHVQDFTGIGHSSGDKYSETQSMGSGILLSERNNSLDEANEFVFTGHNGTAHGFNTNDLPTIAGVNLDQRWDRVYYIERVQGGTIDNGSTDIRITFDFTEAGLALSTDRVYYILYRSGTSGVFSEVPGGTGMASEGKVSINLSSANFASGYFTIVRSDQEIRTWYSLNDGTWDDFNTWSLKPNEPDNPSDEIPGIMDRAVIQDNKTVTVALDNTQCGVLDIIDGTVDFGTTTGNTFSTITGQSSGKIRLADDNFPSGDASGFANASTGGTVIYYGAGYDLSNSRTFRNMVIDLDDAANQLILLANYTLNGSLTITNGELHFGNASTTARTFTVYEDVEVEATGKIRTGTGVTRHQLNLYGDFTNYGDVQFTSRAAVNYTVDNADGIVDVNFRSATRNQNMMLEGPTRFYRIAIEKGVTNTYELYMEATDAAYFELFGYANQGHPDNEQLATNTNAFGLSYGTVRVGPNITIARLNGGGNYNVSTNAILWVDGGTVSKPAGTGEAVVVYGKVKVSNGTFNSYAPSGITTRLSGSFESTGGTTNLNQFRTSVYGSQHQGGYIQSGGTVNLVAGALSADYYRFCLTYTGNVFNMSGGTLHIQQTGGRGGIFINSDEVNQSVTGGTVICDISNANNFIITSRAPFWDMEMRKTVANANNFILDEGVDVGGTDEYLAAQPLKVLRNLRIRGTESGYQQVGFYPVTDATNVNDVYIGGSFFIESGAQYWTAADGNRANNYNNTASLPTIYNTTYFNQTAGTSSVNSLYWGNVGNVFDYDSNGTPEDDENMAEFGDFVLDRNTGNELRIISPGPGAGLRADASLTIDVNGDAIVESGTLDQGRLTFRVWGSITNNDRMGTYFSAGPYPTSTGTPSGAQIRFREDPPVIINAGEGAVFGNVRFNVGPTTLITIENDIYIERMQFMRGIIYMGKYNLKVDDMWDLNNDDIDNTGFFIQGSGISSYLAVANSGRIDNGGGTDNDQEIMIITDGKASDGGLSLKVSASSLADNGGRIRNNTSVLTFPIAFSTDGFATGLTNTYYRPAQAKISNFNDDGYITIRPVRGSLQTTLTTGGEVLQHHWRVEHSDFTILPTVAYRYYYRNQSIAGTVDLPTGAVNEASYVPGKVLDNTPFTRSYESNDIAEQDVDGVFNGPTDANTRVIVVNGNNAGAAGDDLFGFGAGAPGITLEEANYTTGVYQRFTGAVRIFYLRQNGNWRNGNTWSYTRGGGAAGTWPVAGDIAVIRRFSVGYNGLVEITNAETCAKVVFDDENGFSSGCPRLWFSNAASFGSNFNIVEVADTHQGGVLNGEQHGAVVKYDLFEGYAGQFPSGDFGDFNNYPNALVIYTKEGATTNVTLSSAATEYPQVWFDPPNNITFNLPNTHVAFNGMVIVTYGHILRMNTGASGGATFKKRLNIGHSYGIGYFDLAGNAVADQTITAETNINLYNSGRLRINAPAAGGRTHKVIVKNNITMETGCNINLGDGNPLNTNATLELAGEGTHTLTAAGTASVTLSRITMNKGSSQSNTFSFNWPFTLTGPTNGTMEEKAIQMQNGKLILNSSTINLNLSTGGGNFYIPSTSGLVVQAGEVNVSGANSGILLDGLLRVETGGTIDMDGGVGVNNFIEYSASGNATIEVTGGTLTVGSQIRRGTSSTEGILSFTQTGGSVVVGKNAAPQGNRGVFEIVNTGSRFIQTGGTFTVVRPQTAATEASVLLEPSTFSIGNTTLQIGNNDTPAASTITLKSKIALGNITVAGINTPTLRLKDRSLTVNRDLTIGAGCTFDGTGAFNLTVNRHIVNNGTANLNVDTLYLTGTSTSPSADMQNITGNVRVSNLVVEPETSVTLQVASGLEVDEDMYLNNGQLVDGGNEILVKGNVTNSASHVSSNPAAGGLVFGGSSLQRIYGTGQFGRIEVDNTNGVQLENSVSLNNHLTLTNGILQLQSNKLTLGLNADIYGAPFDDSKMIAVGGGDFLQGIQKTFPVVPTVVPLDPYDEADPAFTYQFTFPIGIDNGTVKKYTPVEFYVASNGTQGTVSLHPVNRKHITFDDTQTDVLQYYWIMNSSGISNFTSLMHTHYLNTDVVGAEDLYIGAKLYDDFWAKYEESPGIEVVYEADDYVAYITDGVNLITGEYTAGIEPHIPDQVPLFYTKQSGNWTDASTWEREDGGTVPAGGPVGQRVHIRTAHTVTVTTNYRRAYRTTINGRLVLGTTKNHILGYVAGTGTLSSETSSLPAGDFTNFFACGTGGTMEWAGGTYGLPSSITSYNNLTITGTGTKTFPNADMTICGDLRIEGTAKLKMAAVASGYRYTTISGSVYLTSNGIWEQAARNWVRISGNLEKENTATLLTNFSTSFFELIGNIQSISGTFSGVNVFNNLRINNSNILQTTGIIDIRVFLYLLNGRVLNSTTNLITVTRSNGDGILNVTNGLIEGAIKVNLKSTSPNKFLPVGKNNINKFIYPLDLPVSVGYWTGEYFNTSPTSHAPSMSHENMVAPLQTISQSEYWRITGPNAVASRIRLTLNGTSDVAAGVSNLNNLRIVYWNGTNWEIAGGGASITGTAASGTISTTGTFTFNGLEQYFTIGAVETVVIPTAQITSTDAELCEGDTYQLVIALTGNDPWEIDYNDGTTSFTNVPVASSPHTIDISGMAAGSYTYTIDAVRDIDDNPGFIYGSNPTVEVYTNPTLFNVTSGGNICGATTTTIEVDGSQVGFTYQLYRDAGYFGTELAGTGSPLTFSGVDQAGTYTVRAFNDLYSTCFEWMTGSPLVELGSAATAEITSLISAATICEGEAVEMEITFTGTPPFTFTVVDNFGGSWVDLVVNIGDLSGSGPYTYNFTIPDQYPSWSAPDLPNVFNYNVTSITDDAGCGAGSVVGTGVNVNVFKTPETGPQYHVPNTFGE